MSTQLIASLDKLYKYEVYIGEEEHFFHSLREVDGFKFNVASMLLDWYPQFRAWVKAMNMMRAQMNNEYQSLGAVVRPYTIISDFKLSDVGVRDKTGEWVGTNAEIIRAAAAGPTVITHMTMQGFPGPESYMEAIDTGHECGMNMLVLTGMTHRGADVFMKQPAYMEYMVEFGESCGAHGYIAPGNDYQFVKEVRKRAPEKPIFSPGFGRQVTLRGGDDIGIEEQIKRWREAADDNGGIIVGTYLMKAENHEETVAHLKEQLKG